MQHYQTNVLRLFEFEEAKGFQVKFMFEYIYMKSFTCVLNKTAESNCLPKIDN